MPEKKEAPAAKTQEAEPEYPDTPSGAALAAVGVPADDLSPEEALAHGEAYQAEKRKHRWG